MESLKDVYAFIRIKNEIGTIDPFFRNLKQLFNCGVIGYDPESYGDGSGEYIDNFIRQNSTFKSAFYPFPVNRPYGVKDEIEVQNRLDTYYNHVLSKIPTDSWFLKVDADHYYDPDLMQVTLSYFDQSSIKAYRIILLNVAVYNGKIYVTRQQPFTGVDHCIWKKTDDLYFDYVPFRYEKIVISYPVETIGFGGLHFMWNRKRKEKFNQSTTLTKRIVQENCIKLFSFRLFVRIIKLICVLVSNENWQYTIVKRICKITQIGDVGDMLFARNIPENLLDAKYIFRKYKYLFSDHSI